MSAREEFRAVSEEVDRVADEALAAYDRGDIEAAKAASKKVDSAWERAMSALEKVKASLPSAEK